MHDMAYYIDLSEAIREGRFEKDKIIKRLKSNLVL